MLTTPCRRLHGRLLLLGAALALLACGSETVSGPPGPLELPMLWTFGRDLDGWTLHQRTTGTGGGQASHDASSARVVLAGHDAPGAADAWMSRQVILPKDVDGELWIDIEGIADCLLSQRRDSHARITVKTSDGSTSIVEDWRRVNQFDTPTVIAGGSLQQFLGQTVTITIEQDDEGEQEASDEPESVCVSSIEIFAD